MNDPVILFVKPKAVKQSDKIALQNAGVIVIEVADPQSVKLTRAAPDLNGSDLLACAAIAINRAGSFAQQYFAEEICKAICIAHGKQA